MAFEDIQFPVYRKYKNGKSYFKIISRNEFEEIQLIGSKKVLNTFMAYQFPEMNQVYDLVYQKEISEEISENCYNEMKASVNE